MSGPGYFDSGVPRKKSPGFVEPRPHSDHARREYFLARNPTPPSVIEMPRALSNDKLASLPALANAIDRTAGAA